METKGFVTNPYQKPALLSVEEEGSISVLNELMWLAFAILYCPNQDRISFPFVYIWPGVVLLFCDANMLPTKLLSSAFSYIRGPTRAAFLPGPCIRARQVHNGTAKSSYITASTEKDPYQYQVGFGNRFASEAV